MALLYTILLLHSLEIEFPRNSTDDENLRSLMSQNSPIFLLSYKTFCQQNKTLPLPYYIHSLDAAKYLQYHK